MNSSRLMINLYSRSFLPQIKAFGTYRMAKSSFKLISCNPLKLSVSTRNPHQRFSNTNFLPAYNQFRFASSNEKVTLDLQQSEPQTNQKKKTDVSLPDLQNMLKDSSIQLIDVRDTVEIERTGMIGNAVNIPLNILKTALKMSDEEFLKTYNVKKPCLTDTDIVFYGLKEVKSGSACQLAHSLGYKKARHFPGGWAEWSKVSEEVS